MTEVTLSRAVRPATDAALVARPAGGPVLPRFSATVERMGNRQDDITAGRPLHRRADPVAAVSGDTLTVNNTSGSDSLVDGYFDGCPARFYRITDGVMSLVREDVVAGWRSRNRRPSMGARRLTNTTYRWAIDGGYRRGATVWFAVSTIAADGTYSPPSAWQSYTTPATHVGQSISNAIASNAAPTTESGALETPANFALTTENDGRIALMTWDAVAGAHGYFVWVSQYDPAEPFVDDTVTLAGGVGKAALQPGDLMIVERRLTMSDGRAQQGTDRVYHYQSFYNKPQTPFGIPGEIPGTYAYEDDPVEGCVVRVTLAQGETVSRFEGTHGGSAQPTLYYEVPDPDHVYGATIRAKGVVGGEQIVVTRTTHLGDAHRTITLTTEWADHTVTWPAPGSLDTSDNVRLTTVSITGPCDLWFAHAVFHRAQPGDVPMQLTAEEAAHLATFAPSSLRMHQFCKSKPWTYSLDDITRRVGFGGVTRGSSLPQMLGICEAAGIAPWLQIEWVWPEAEFLGLVEYLCAPYDPETDTPETKPWAYRRHAQGHTAPWLDAFGEVLFELGNENWNVISSFYMMPGVSGQSGARANALMLDYVVGVMRSSPYWSAAAESKFKWVIGGRNNNSGFNTDSTISLTADYLTIANYNGGWDSGLTEAQGANDPAAWETAVGIVALGRYGPTLGTICAQASVGRAKPLLAGTYEAGPGYVLNGLNGAAVTWEESEAQEVLMKSVGVGMATLDCFLFNAAGGHVIQNYFTFGGRREWASHARFDRGNAMNASALWLGLLNRTFLPGRIGLIRPLITARGLLAGKAEADLLGAYRLDGGDVRGVALCNRRVDAPITVTLVAETVGATGLTRYTLSGGYAAHNTTPETRDAVALVAEPLPFADRLVVTVPPGEAVIHAWSRV